MPAPDHSDIHYGQGKHPNSRNRKRNTADVFWSRVRKKDIGCWPWIAATNEYGYGVMNFKRRSEVAHRISWQLAYGEIPIGMCVCHKCDNPPCVNPEHLFLGRRVDNNRDRDSKGRHVPLKGIKNPRAKLTLHDVAEIRASVGIGQRVLAKAYDVAQFTIWKIRKGISYQ